MCGESVVGSVVPLERRGGGVVFRLEVDGTFSYLTADGRFGWRGLCLSAVIDGEARRGRLAAVESDGPDGATVTATYRHAPEGLSERVTFRASSDPPALTVERVLTNAGVGEVRVAEVRTELSGPAQLIIQPDP